MDNNFFNRSLSDFSFDVACGAAIRHLFDIGLSADEIKKQLTYPATLDQIKSTIWKYLSDSGKVLLEKPDKELEREPYRVTYEKVQGQYGRTSFRQVTVKNPDAGNRYIRFDIGVLMVKNPDSFMKIVSELDEYDRKYVMSIPWPAKTVYVLEDERMARIMDKIKDFE